MERDLGSLLEGDFATPIELIAPDLATYSTSANDPQLPLMACLGHGSMSVSASSRAADDLGTIVTESTVVTLRRSSLTRVPKTGEAWLVRIAVQPTANAPAETFVLGGPVEESVLGIIRLTLTKAEQGPTFVPAEDDDEL